MACVFPRWLFSRLMACTAVLAMAAGFAATARSEPLGAVVAHALNQHPSVRAAMAGRDVTGAELREKRSAYYPELNVNAATGRVYGDNSTSRGLTTTRGAAYSWNHEAGMTVRQMIFDGMETPRRVDAAEARREAANINIVDARENLALRVVNAYIDVLHNREAMALIQAHARKIADYRARIAAMVESGAADESMAVQAHDIQIQLDATLADIAGQRDRAMADYAEAAGRPATEDMIRPAVDPARIPVDVDTAVRAARETHPSLRVAAMQGVASGHEIGAERAALYPDLSGEVSVLKKDLDDRIGGEVVDQRALLRMNWTFSTGGAQMARVQQSLHRHAETIAKMETLGAQIEREIRSAYAEMDASKNRLEANRARVDVSADLIRTYEKQFEAAKITLLNLLQAENTHFNARLGALNADYRHLAAQYAVLASTGHLQDALNVQLAGAHE